MMHCVNVMPDPMAIAAGVEIASPHRLRMILHRRACLFDEWGENSESKLDAQLVRIAIAGVTLFASVSTMQSTLAGDMSPLVPAAAGQRLM